jgi:alanine dehydrogenase
VSKAVKMTDEQIAEVMTPLDFVASCHDAFRLYGQGEMVNPARQESLTRQGDADLFRLVLPGEWIGRYRGRKVIEERSDVTTGRLGERTAVIELEDVQMGLQVMLDAEHITNMRTGAAGVLGARYLCAAPIRQVAILGTGRIARALALCADVALQPQVVQVTSRSAERRAAFARAMGERLQAELRMADTIATCVADADAVLAAVPTPHPILFRHMLKDGAHLSVLGGDRRTQQLDLSLFLSQYVIPDHAEQVLNSGDFLAAQHAGAAVMWVRDAHGVVQTIGQAALGLLEHWRGRGVITYFSGMAVQDVHAAAMAWRRFRA